MEQYDSAVHYLTLAVEAAKMSKDSFWIALATGNLGHAYYKMGRYDEAWPLIETDYKVSIRMNQPGSASNAAHTLATMALYKGSLHEAEEYMRYADKNKITYEPEGLINYYSNLYTYTRLKGNFALAVQYADSLDLYTKRLEADRDKKILEQAKLRVQVDKYNKSAIHGRQNSFWVKDMLPAKSAKNEHHHLSDQDNAKTHKGAASLWKLGCAPMIKSRLKCACYGKYQHYVIN